MKKFDTLLFDLDGTLTDSTEGILKCLAYALERMGYEVPEDTNKFLGPPLRQSLTEFLGMSMEQADEAVRIFRERYSVVGLFENRVYDGIPGMLERLKSGGKRLMVATSKAEIYAVRIFERFGLAQYFEIVGGAELDGSRDYKDEVIEYVLAKAGITDRSTVLMIGDRRQDVLGAHKTNIECMGILWGFGSMEELTQAGADYIARTPQEAADMLLS
ncbi:MAG: HAD hydrolase-like protein [Ruminococcus sp.]|uniref:HAD hydrolase-like protein n=1 Tax=Ruminococcus sp. TaxID=41978 RepID=UPI0025D9DB9F|nr:HAD hydrolase-like protein [Ruminococcus sp.]MBR6994815.1 HAD hydrolase-like protein [Ruminococcus sp.]